jgi:hypothetical protein
MPPQTRRQTAPFRTDVVAHHPTDHAASRDGPFIGNFGTLQHAPEALNRLAAARFHRLGEAHDDAPYATMVPGYRVKRLDADAPEAYWLISPDGAVYRLMRVTTDPDLLYVVDRTGRTCDIDGHQTFTDRTGSLAMIN